MVNDRVDAWVQRLNASLETEEETAEASAREASHREGRLNEGEALGAGDEARFAADDASEDSKWW